MSQTAFLFPGQGSQFVGMAKDLHDAYPQVRGLFDSAEALLEFPIRELMFGAGGDPEAEQAALTQTDVTQPALYLHSMAALAVLEADAQLPDMVAGHSLGEYSALAAARAISFADGLRIVRLRGQLMAGAGDERPGTMAAVLGLDNDAVEALCRAATEAGEGLVQPANYNASGQVVISGDVAAVERAVEMGKDHGARRLVPLPVSGAFHSPLMEQARDGLAEALRELPIEPPRCPVYLNVTAAPSQDPDEIRQRLLEQLTAPVRWSQTLQQMQADGATRFVEVGAGKVLSGLARRTLGRTTDTATAGTADEVAALLQG